MARLVIAKDFLADYAKLQPPVRKAVDAAIAKFAEHTHAGLHLEKLGGSRDPKVRTIRIDGSYRGVVLAPERGEEYLLITVRPHDDANQYATSRRFTVNQALGVLEVRNQEALDDLTPALRRTVEDSPKPLFDHVKDADLVRLGVDADVLPVVRLLATGATAGTGPPRWSFAGTGGVAGGCCARTWPGRRTRERSRGPAEPPGVGCRTHWVSGEVPKILLPAHLLPWGMRAGGKTGGDDRRRVTHREVWTPPERR